MASSYGHIGIGPVATAVFTVLAILVGGYVLLHVLALSVALLAGALPFLILAALCYVFYRLGYARGRRP